MFFVEYCTSVLGKSFAMFFLVYIDAPILVYRWVVGKNFTMSSWFV